MPNIEASACHRDEIYIKLGVPCPARCLHRLRPRTEREPCELAGAGDREMTVK